MKYLCLLGNSLLVLLLCGCVLGGHVSLRAQQVEIFLEGETLDVLFDGGFFLEGPAMAPDGSLYCADITFTNSSGMQAGHIWKTNLRTGETTLFRSPSGMANGIIFAENGDMLQALGADHGGRCIIRTDMQTGKSYIVASRFEGNMFNSPNDLTRDSKGRIYFTDPRYSGDEPLDMSIQGVYRVNTDGSVHRISNHNGTPNGILISPNEKYLYVASLNGPYWAKLNALVRYELDSLGDAHNPEIFLDFSGDAGPDGMTIDNQGNLYLARPAAKPGIYVYSPAGKELDYLPTPTPLTNVTFGQGEWDDHLFITAGNKLMRIKVNARGFNYAYKNRN